jgi:hypothetical protein
MSSMDKMLEWKDRYFDVGSVIEDDNKSSVAELNQMIQLVVLNERSREPRDLKPCKYLLLLVTVFMKYRI